MCIPPRPSQVVVDLDHCRWTPRRPRGARNGETFLPLSSTWNATGSRISGQSRAHRTSRTSGGRHLLGRRVPASNARDEAAVSSTLAAASRFAVSISDLAWHELPDHFS